MKKDRHAFIVERSFFVPIDSIAECLHWVSLAATDGWRANMKGIFWNPDLGFWATDGRRAHVWMPSDSQKKVIGDNLDFDVDQFLDIFDKGFFVNIVKPEGQKIDLKKVIPEMTPENKVMSWSIGKRRIDTELPQLIAKTGLVMNLLYLRDLATGDCWDVFKKGKTVPVVFKSASKMAIIMPMTDD